MPQLLSGDASESVIIVLINKCSVLWCMPVINTGTQLLTLYALCIFHVPSFSLLLLLFNLCSPMISRHPSCPFSSSVLRVYSRNRFGASKEKGFSQICGQCVSSSIDKNLFHRMHLQTRSTSCSLFLSFVFVPRPQTVEGPFFTLHV